MHINQDPVHQSIFSQDGSIIREVDDFKYIVSFIANSKKDFNSRKGEAWTACNELSRIWQSDIAKSTSLGPVLKAF